MGVATIALLTEGNCLGVRRGALIQNFLTVIKVGTLGLMTLLLLSAKGSAEPVGPPAATDWSWSSLGLAAIAVLYAYECWHLVTFAAGEVAQPEKSIPRGLIAGMGLVIVLYLAANAGYLHVLPVRTMQDRPDVAAVAMETVVGRSAGLIVSAMILFSLLGAMNGLILSGPRVYYAMAPDGVFFKKLGALPPTYHVPVYAILFQGVLAVGLTLVASFAQLAGYAISSVWISYGLTVAGVWRLRRRAEGAPPFRCPAYPLLGGLFVAFALFIFLSQVAREPRQAAIGVAVILLGFPAYRAWSRRRSLPLEEPTGRGAG